MVSVDEIFSLTDPPMNIYGKERFVEFHSVYDFKKGTVLRSIAIQYCCVYGEWYELKLFWKTHPQYSVVNTNGYDKPHSLLSHFQFLTKHLASLGKQLNEAVGNSDKKNNASRNNKLQGLLNAS